jgi:hypothetical protein
MLATHTVGIRLSTALALAFFVFGTESSASRQSQRAERAREVLDLVDAELVHLELPGPVAGPLSVAFRSSRFTDVLVLEPSDVRAPGYRLVVQREDGSLSTSEGGAPRTLRGRLAGQPGSLVSASLSDDGLQARILLPNGESLWLEPLAGRVVGASALEYVLYADDDVAPNELPCAEPALPGEATGGSGTTSGTTGSGEAPSTGAASGLKVAELACDADYEYFQAWGSVSAVEARIHLVIDALNLQYETEVGITHAITTIMVRTSAAQPYTATDPNELLVQFRDEWNANHAGIQRDVAHLFTGKQIDGSVIGIAYLGVICNGTYGYGLSQSDFSSNFASVTDLTAHELGHNWNAGHCSCTSFTMNPYITSSNTFEPVATIPTIVAFRDSRTCLDDGGTSPPPDPVDPEINLTLGEFITTGSITSGSHGTTHEEDDLHEALMEASNGGKPANRRSRLSHEWSFDVQAGSAYTFFLDAHRTTNAEGDDFLFSYSRDGSAYHPMVTVTKAADDDVLQSFLFPEDVSGPLYVRVEDTDRTAGNGTKDTLYVDHMYVHTELDGEDTTPPSTPTGLVAVPGDGTAALDWDDNGEGDLDGYNVRRGTSAGGPFVQVNPTLLTASDWTDSGLVNGTTYHYTVSAVDLSGNESVESAAIKVTPNTGGGAASALVSSIVVTAVNQGGGSKRGRADVWIVDELGSPVADALVTGTFTGGLAETLAVVTDGQGWARFDTSASRKGNLQLTFCVEDVSHAGLNYAPSSNVETCDVR